MILYHGSCLEIVHHDLNHSRDNVDFGRGFYTTPIYEQAVRWCRKFEQRGKKGIVSCFELDETAYNKLKVLNYGMKSQIYKFVFVRKLHL